MSGNSKSLKIECKVNCGNSPKKNLLKDFTIALVKNDMDFCLEQLRDDVTWEIIGTGKIQGKKETSQELNKWMSLMIKELKIHNIITHGNAASVNGTILQNNDERIAFCHVYQFGSFKKSAKIKEITSYVIPQPD